MPLMGQKNGPQKDIRPINKKSLSRELQEVTARLIGSAHDWIPQRREIQFGSYRAPGGDGGKNGKRISAQQSVLVVSISQSAKLCFCPAYLHTGAYCLSEFQSLSSRCVFLKMGRRLSPLMMNPRPAAQLVACRNCSLTFQAIPCFTLFLHITSQFLHCQDSVLNLSCQQCSRLLCQRGMRLKPTNGRCDRFQEWIWRGLSNLFWHLLIYLAFEIKCFAVHQDAMLRSPFGVRWFNLPLLHRFPTRSARGCKMGLYCISINLYWLHDFKGLATCARLDLYHFCSMLSISGLAPRHVSAPPSLFQLHAYDNLPLARRKNKENMECVVAV